MPLVYVPPYQKTIVAPSLLFLGNSSGLTVPVGYKSLIIVTELLTNGYQQHGTNTMTVNGVPATLAIRSITPLEYDQDISIFYINNVAGVANFGGYSPYAPGVVGVYAVDKLLGPPDNTAQAHYPSLNTSIPVYDKGLAIAGYGTFNGGPYISALFVADYQISNPSYCGAHLLPTADVTQGVSAGPVSQYYGQNLAIVSWKPSSLT